MATNGNDSAPKKGKGKVKLEKFPWTDDLVVKLLNCLKEYHRINGYCQGFDWGTVNKEFAKAHGIFLPQGVAKNKTEHMKKQWRNWVDLRFNVTGGGWDPATGKVTMSEEWWGRQDKTSLDKYRVFKKRGVPPVISNLWDDVFANIVATGKNVMSSMMDQTAARQLTADVYQGGMDLNGGSGIGVYGKHSCLDDDSDSDGDLRAIVARVRVEGEDDDVLASIHDAFTTTPTTQGTQEPLSTGGNISQQLNGRGGSADAVNGRKKRRRPSTASISFNEHMEHVGKTGDRILSILEGDVGSTSNAGEPQDRQCSFAECLEALKRMVADGVIEDESDAWCIGVSKLAVQENINVFISLPDDSHRKAWLNFELVLLGLAKPK